MSLAVIVPTLEEQKNIRPLMDKIISVKDVLDCKFSVVFVDDEGRDYTSRLLSYYESIYDFVHVVRRGSRRGLASAYLEGLKYVSRNLDCDFIVQMDADLQHPPERIVDMCAILSNGADVVIASRFVDGSAFDRGNLARITFARTFCLFAKTLLRLHVEDATSGFRGIKRNAAMLVLRRPIFSKGFAYQLETLCRYERNHLRIVEIPFRFSQRRSGRSKLLLMNMLEFVKCLVYSALFDLRS